MNTDTRKAVLYLRVSKLEQHPETQLHDLRQLARQRGLEITSIYEDKVTGARDSRPGLDQMMADARQGKFNVLLVWASDRVARSVRHFLQVLDEMAHMNIEFISFREQIDTSGPLGKAVLVIVGVVAELERSLIREGGGGIEAGEAGRPADRKAQTADRPGGHPSGPRARNEPERAREGASGQQGQHL